MSDALDHHVDRSVGEHRAQAFDKLFDNPVVDFAVAAKWNVHRDPVGEPKGLPGGRTGRDGSRQRRFVERGRRRMTDERRYMGHCEAGTKRAVLIAGPTASGKSALALALAERIGGIIINADSMQVYRDLRIITARPTTAEEARVPHRLYGHVDAAESYSVGCWLADAAAAVEEARRLRRFPLVVGGTGLYFKALTQGLSAVPPIPVEIRAAVRNRLAQHGAAVLHAELVRRDPATAVRLKPKDGVRIARALEVLQATGRTLSDWHRVGMPAPVDTASAVQVFLEPERDELHRRIEARFDAMLKSGAIEEVRALDARGVDPLSPAMKAHGVPWLRRVLAGDMTLADAAEAAKRDTRRYTKRQRTWFRHQLPGFAWIAPEHAAERIQEALSKVSA
jgi:tRNA dimethylallyltransferase